MRNLDDLGDLTGQTALVRVDYNVPMQNGKVTDTTRIKASLPTIKTLMRKGAKIALLSHFGRPKGVRNQEFSLAQIIPAVRDVLGVDVGFAVRCFGETAKSVLDSADAGSVTLLENTRFESGETSNDLELANAIAALGDVFISDAFSIAHRAHASNYGIATLLPSYSGASLQREISALERAVSASEKPVMAVVGGAKISSKIAVLEHLVSKVDRVFIGGGMANTFLLAQGVDMGKSLVERDQIETAQAVMKAAKAHGCEILLPEDGLFSKEFAENAPSRLGSVTEIQADEMMLDIGTQSVERFETAVQASKTLLWNGPMGAFEVSPFDQGTVKSAQAVAARCAAGDMVAVAGGGDTVSALNHASVGSDFSHVSTAGGAFLEWLEGKILPGVAILS